MKNNYYFKYLKLSKSKGKIYNFKIKTKNKLKPYRQGFEEANCILCRVVFIGELIAFYSKSTLMGYLMSNPIYTNLWNIYDL